MSGVFLSYSRSDRIMADRVIQGFRALGVDVWWDEDMPGVDWQEELERRLTELAAVVVLWTPSSSASVNVRDEARLGLRTEKLVNLLAGVSEPPFPYDRMNGLPIDGWDGMTPHPGWTSAVQTVEALVVEAGDIKEGAFVAALASREQDMRDRHTSLERAQAVFAETQAAEGEASEAAAEAQAALARSEEDFARAGEARLSPAILRTAQQEVEARHAVKDEADKARAAAKRAMSDASRELARARAALDAPAYASAPVSLMDTPVNLPKPKPVERAAPLVAPEVQPVVEPREEAPVAPVPQAAEADFEVVGTTPGISPSNPMLLAGAAAVLALLVGVFFWFNRDGTGDDAGAGDKPEVAEVANEPSPEEAAIASLVGDWALPGIGCELPVRFSAKGDTIERSFAEETVRVDLELNEGETATYRAADGGVYRLSGKDEMNLSMADGTTTRMTKCGN